MAKLSSQLPYPQVSGGSKGLYPLVEVPVPIKRQCSTKHGEAQKNTLLYFVPFSSKCRKKNNLKDIVNENNFQTKRIERKDEKNKNKTVLISETNPKTERNLFYSS